MRVHRQQAPNNWRWRVTTNLAALSTADDGSGYEIDTGGEAAFPYFEAADQNAMKRVHIRRIPALSAFRKLADATYLEIGIGMLQVRLSGRPHLGEVASPALDLG
jgi:hypothetical protein